MNRDWTDFKSIHTNLGGAREAFESACETLFRKKHEGEHVSQVSVKQGDGGVDIFIGEFGVEPITVIQCKFFLETFGDSQKGQIRESFNTAINSNKYELKEWILCIPRVIDIDETSWWFKWKHKKITEHSKNNYFIKIADGNALIDMFKELNLYDRIFKIIDSQKIAEIHAAVVPQKAIISNMAKACLVLFNNYTPKNEEFYLEREQDSEFNESLTINNIWLFGKSGVGKTALVNRNLIKNNIEYCFCDMSPVTISESDDVLSEILCTVEEKYGIERNQKEGNIIKQIIQILRNCSSSKTVIVIDELYVDDNVIVGNIANSIMQLVAYFGNCYAENELKFVVSTIYNPKIICQNKSKASGCFQYICCDSWSGYTDKLFEILQTSLNLDLETSKPIILENCKDSPRVLKSIFKKIFTCKDSSPQSVDRVIKMTLEEIV